MTLVLSLALIAGAVVTPSPEATPKFTSAELAVSGRRSWDAMTCAGYAETAGYLEEQRRLSELGIGEGRKFLDAIKSGRIENKDISSSVPIAITLIMQGPSVDFIVGRFWEASSEYASDKIWEFDGRNRDRQNPPSEEIRKVNAQNFYRDSSCQSLR